MDCGSDNKFITRTICMILLNMNYILFFFQEVHLLHFKVSRESFLGVKNMEQFSILHI